MSRASHPPRYEVVPGRELLDDVAALAVFFPMRSALRRRSSMIWLTDGWSARPWVSDTSRRQSAVRDGRQERRPDSLDDDGRGPWAPAPGRDGCCRLTDRQPRPPWCRRVGARPEDGVVVGVGGLPLRRGRTTTSEDARRCSQASGVTKDADPGAGIAAGSRELRQTGHVTLEATAIKIRPSLEADVDGWLDLLEEVAAEGQWIGTEAPIDREERGRNFLERVRMPDGISLVATDRERVVGSLGVSIERGLGELGMFLAANLRGRGVGRRLLEDCVQRCRDARCHKLTLTVWPHNHSALALYAGLGFRTEGVLRRAYRRNNGELWDALAMGLILDEASAGGPRAGVGLPPTAIELPTFSDGPVTVRPWRASDATRLSQAADDPGIRRWMDLFPVPYTVAEGLAWTASTRIAAADGLAAHFAVDVDGQFAGGVGVRLDATGVGGVGEVGYWLSESTRGRGVATAAVRLIARWALRPGPLGLHRLQLHAAVDNAASRAVAVRAGFQIEGVSRSFRHLHGEPTNFAVYSRVMTDL